MTYSKEFKQQAIKLSDEIAVPVEEHLIVEFYSK